MVDQMFVLAGQLGGIACAVLSGWFAGREVADWRIDRFNERIPYYNTCFDNDFGDGDDADPTGMYAGSNSSCATWFADRPGCSFGSLGPILVLVAGLVLMVWSWPWAIEQPRNWYEALLSHGLYTFLGFVAVGYIISRLTDTGPARAG